jgi:predicted metalloprotease with PDZ domain
MEFQLIAPARSKHSQSDHRPAAGRRSMVAALLLVPLALEAAATESIVLSVDASDAPQRIFHVREEIPVTAGDQTLYFVKWIPGEHSPSGQAVNLVNLQISGGDATLEWHRDPVDMFAIHSSVPAGTRSMTVTFDYVSPTEGFDFQGGVTATANLAIVNWNQVLLYPQGHSADELTFSAQLRLPDGWKYGTALPVDQAEGNHVRFAPVSLTTLVDSPVNLGRHYRHIDLSPGSTPAYSMDLVAESAAALQIDSSALQAYEQLIPEANQLFGGPHLYREYHFLVTLSDPIAKIAQEHHESSDNRFPERSLMDLASIRVQADVLPHEFVHAWSGKSRRPQGLTTVHYQEPMQDDLLWVYEGLTQYLGEVLAARSGAWSPETYRENLALTAAMLDRRTGRAWRPLADTALAAQLLYFAPESWSNIRRSVDFYPEGTLVWLAVDTLIREQTGGKKSIDDFCRGFFGYPGKPPEVSSYTYDDLLNGLHQIAPYDWDAFFQRTVASVNERAPTEGIENGGWKLVYTEHISDLQESREQVMQMMDLGYSLGLLLDTGEAYGKIKDVVMDSPARAAGLTPGMRMVAVSGRKWSPDILREAIQAAKDSPEPIELLIEDHEFFSTVRIDYHLGQKYPQLQRVPAQPDLIAEILQSRSDRTGNR